MADQSISNLSAKTTPVDADLVVIVDSADTTMSANGTDKKLTWANLKATIKTYYDAVTSTFTNKTYDTAGTGNVFKINGTSITDKTGTGKVVLDTSPTITSPVINTAAYLPIDTEFFGATSGHTTVSASAVASGTLTLPAATDTLVGKATTDTLTNKTLTTPTVASFANANHNHSNSAGGGQITQSGLNLTNSSADANGWTKKDYGNWQVYERTVSITSKAVSANTGASIATYSMPVGVTNTSTLRFYTGVLGGFGGRIYATIDNGNTTSSVTSVTLWLGNSTTGSITFSGFVYIQAITT